MSSLTGMVHGAGGLAFESFVVACTRATAEDGFASRHAGFKPDALIRQNAPDPAQVLLPVRQMDRDFFAFCASMTTQERKAMAQLSRVRHFKAGETVLDPEAPPKMLFVINRGVIELTQTAPATGMVTYLSRGDVLGAPEALLGLPPTESARARDQVSAQCFSAQDFDRLTREIPAFFRFIAERLAIRVGRYAVRAGQPLELAGTFINFDLVTIFQTIGNSMRTGELTIVDMHKNTLGHFYFEKGTLRAGRFQHLLGEEAFWQLFLADSSSGGFSFTSGETRPAYYKTGAVTQRGPASLIDALRSRDELQSLLHQLNDREALLHRRETTLELSSSMDPTIQYVARNIWEIIGRQPTRLSGIYPLCFVCDLKIYQAVHELITADLISLESDAAVEECPPTKLAVA